LIVCQLGTWHNLRTFFLIVQEDYLMQKKLQFYFDFDRSLQAAAYLLKKTKGKKLSYLHLLKMLYIADREYLAENGYMITGDRVVAMQRGPVLSHILDLIKGKVADAEKWQCSIQTFKGHDVRLIDDPGDGDLSRAITAKLDAVFERFGDMEPFRVVDLTHDFSEWIKHYTVGTSTLIPWQDILVAQGKERMTEAVVEQINLQSHQRRLKKVIDETR
jgi:uncharacterized phage-associated protein